MARFLTLSAACVASLCFGAYLSYQAAERQDSEARSASAPEIATPAPVAAVSNPVSASVASPAVADAPEARAGYQPGRLAGLRAGLFSHSEFEPGKAAPVEAETPELRPSEAPIQQAALETPVAPVAPAAPADSGRLDLSILQEFALPSMRDAGAPLPPRRPASFAATTPAPGQTQVAVAPAPDAPGAFGGIANALAAMRDNVSAPGPGFSAAPGLAPGPGPGLGPDATAEPQGKGAFRKGNPVFVRIFKQEGTLELWMKRGGRFALYKSYPICKWSGRLGPKTKFADYQSPEGFYSVSSKQLNPHSAYHLAFDIGYPNAYDRRHGATGGLVMVHGDCKSVGCFAMTNRGIDGIYAYVAAALANGQREVPVHIFPFRMTDQAIAREAAGGNILAFLGDNWGGRDWSPFWRNLKEGYDLFERSHLPPTAYACGDRYEFGGANGGCSRIAGW